MANLCTGDGWEVSRKRAVAGRGVLEYCAIDSEGLGLLVLCHSNYLFVGDSVQPITKPDPQSEKTSEDQPKFTFQQSDGLDNIFVHCYCFIYSIKYQLGVDQNSSCVMPFSDQKIDISCFRFNFC